VKERRQHEEAARPQLSHRSRQLHRRVALARSRSLRRQAGRQPASKLLLASQSARNAILTSVHEAVVVAVNGADHGRPVRLDPQDAGDIVALDELNRGGSSALAL
jgi:hypothetical protein